jgi:hypothetical protein
LTASSPSLAKVRRHSARTGDCLCGIVDRHAGDKAGSTTSNLCSAQPAGVVGLRHPLAGQVCREGSLRHYLVFVLKQLQISGVSLPRR